MIAILDPQSAPAQLAGEGDAGADGAIGAQKERGGAWMFYLLIGHFEGSDKAPKGSVTEPRRSVTEPRRHPRAREFSQVRDERAPGGPLWESHARLSTSANSPSVASPKRARRGSGYFPC
jgi:hypothetical protein